MSSIEILAPINDAEAPPSPPPQEPIVPGWGQEAVRIRSLGRVPVAAGGWPTACFPGQLYGVHYARLTASVILSDGSAKRNDEPLGPNGGLDEALTFSFFFLVGA